MSLIKRKGIRLGLVAGLVATGLVGVTSLTASGQTSTPTEQSVGSLVLTAISSQQTAGKLVSTIEYRDASGTPVGEPQTISANGPCDTLIDAGPRLLSVDTLPPDSRPVLVSDGLGILSGNQNCGAEGLIDGSEDLALALGAYFKTGAFSNAGVYVSTTKLSVVRSGPARLSVQLDNALPIERTVPEGIVTDQTFGGFRDRILVSSTASRFNRGIILVRAEFDLMIPLRAPGAPTIGTAVSNNPGQATVTWTAPADDGGPDITGYTVQQSANGGAWAAATIDPATGTSTTRTVTNLANGTAYTFRVAASNDVGTGDFSQASNSVTPWAELVDCGEEVTDDGVDGEIAQFAAFLRGENGAKSTGCVDVGVVVEIVGNDWVYWDNSSVGVNGQPQQVQGMVTIDWAPLPVAKADVPTQIDYDGPGTAADFADRLWCKSFSIVSDEVVGGKRVVVFDAELPDFNGDGNVNGKAPWCLVSSSQSMDGGFVNRTDVFFGSGDPLAKFR